MTRLVLCSATLTCVALLGLGAASAQAEEQFDRVLAEMGAEYYAQYCASCHGRDGAGRGPAAGALKKRPADLTRIAQRRGGTFPDGKIARFIDGRFEVTAHGSREMPIWGRRLGERIPEAGISEEIVRGRMLVLVEYLKSIQQAD